MTTFIYDAVRFEALAASPIAEVAQAAAAYHDALNALHAEGSERGRVAAMLANADALDEAATLAAITTGGPEPRLVDRDALTVRLADAERRVAARTTVAASLQLRAIDAGREHAEAWTAAVKVQQAEARVEYLAAIDSVRAAAEKLDALEGQAAAPRHLLDPSGGLRQKFLNGTVTGDDGGRRALVARALASIASYRTLDEPQPQHAAPGQPMTPADLAFYRETGDPDPWAALARGSAVRADVVIDHL